MERIRRNLFLFELLESSESSSDEDEMAVLMAYALQRERMPSPRIKNYIRDVVDNYTDVKFQKNFRLSRPTCEHLIEKYWMTLRNDDARRRGITKKTAKSDILSFLWYAGNKSTLRTISERFDKNLSTLHYSMERVMDFLLKIAPTVIVFPYTEAKKVHAANEFQQISGIPGVIGCIDGCLINIRTPANKIPSTYVDRHDQTSMTLQGICDADKKFIDVFTGVPSKIHDARVFQKSFIYPVVHRMNQQFHLLGDSAYGISENVLTPYRDYGNLNNIKRKFNRKFCGTRVQIENTFAILKARFRGLIRIDFHTPTKIAKFIISCCVLHNLCIERNDFLTGIDDEQEVCRYEADNAADVAIDKRAGEQKRDLIAMNL